MRAVALRLTILGVLAFSLYEIGLPNRHDDRLPVSEPAQQAMQSPTPKPVAKPQEPTLAPPRELAAACFASEEAPRVATIQSAGSVRRQVIFVTVEAEQTGTR